MAAARVSSDRTTRAALVGAGTAYAAGLLAYAIARPRAGDVAGLVELVDDFAPWWFAPAPVLVLGGLGLRSRLLTLAGLASAATFVANWGHLFARWRQDTQPVYSNLKIMSFNMLGVNRRHADLAAAVAAEAPDVVASQELTADAAQSLIKSLGREYPYRALRPAPRASGSGVFSRYPLKDCEAFRLSEGGHWSQRMVVETPRGPVTLFNVHLPIPKLIWSRRHLGPFRVPSSFDSGRRRAEVERLAEMLDAVTGPLLVAGDFNLTERSHDYSLIRARLRDAFRTAGRGFGHTFPRLGSFPEPMPAPWPMVRLDYVWYSAHFQPISARLGRCGGSDHHPLIVRLTRAPA